MQNPFTGLMKLQLNQLIERDRKIVMEKLKNVDIEKEYYLIQEKKSGLSKSLRELVVKIFESQLKEEEE